MFGLKFLPALALAATAITFTACGKDGAKADDGKKADKPAAVKPFEGKLTEKLLEDAKKGVRPYMKWAEAEAHLLAKVGKATAVEGKDHYWAAVEGDKCTTLSVEKTDANEVGTAGVEYADKSMKANFESCSKRARK